MKPNQHQTSRPAAAEARILLIVTLAFCLGALPSLLAQSVPEQINYQGILLTGQGQPITAPTDVEFRIWDSATLTDVSGLKWGRLYRITPDTNGAFNVVLSQDTGIASSGAPDVSLYSVFTGVGSDSRYLELTVVGSTAIRPRQRFVASPYSLLAHDLTPRQDFAIGGVLTVSGAANVNSLSTPGAVTAGSTVTASNFVGYGTIPIGGIIMWSGATNQIPAGWALCDGGTHAGRVTPDLRDRFVTGAGRAYSVAATGGTDQVTLTTNQMPTHLHIGQTATDGAHYHSGNPTYNYSAGGGHTIGELGGLGDPFTVGQNGSSHKHLFGTDNSGGGQAHENRPPYYALAFIMRVQ
jgi:microcystin-dependent protein